MNIKRILGIDTLQQKYSYSTDPQFGYTSSEKIPDHWVPTTCGYCSGSWRLPLSRLEPPRPQRHNSSRGHTH